MSIYIVLQRDAEARIAELGETFDKNEMSFSVFEEKFLEAYEMIFDSISKVATVKESGRRGDAELAMSKWVEPSRAIGVVVKKKSALKPELIKAVGDVLSRLKDRFAVVVDDYPTVVYVLPDGDILVIRNSLPEDLRALGLENEQQTQ